MEWSREWQSFGALDEGSNRVPPTMMEGEDLLTAFDQYCCGGGGDPVVPLEAPDLSQETSFSDSPFSVGFCFDSFGSDHSGKDGLKNDAVVMGQNREEMADDSFLPSLTDNDWFMTSIFGDQQDPVLNDKNLSETAPQPCIKSEHSYSSNNLSPASPTIKEEPDMSVFHHSQSTTPSMDPSTPNNNNNNNQHLLHHHHHHSSDLPPQTFTLCESPSSDPLLSAMVHHSPADSPPTPTFAHAPTFILATTATSPSLSSAVPTYNGQAVFPSGSTTATVHIKAEPDNLLDTLQEQTVSMETTVLLPPTPPGSSNGSDSDGSQSPQRSAPNSPQRQSPMPQSGVLILSEEEKRTLISEGYPVPAKLPLTKQEEKNLKKVRRKIKNKISAQESRRKKKEYLEQLEKRVEAFNHENSDLKKKVETLENNNRSLLGQLHKLQTMLTKVPKTAAASATQTGTALMVLVLCFAVFLGGGGMGGGPPSPSLNVGYRSAPSYPPLAFQQQQPGPLRVQPNMGPGVPRAADTADDYTTPNLKSRVLMAFSKEEPDDACDEYRPLMPWDRDESCPTANNNDAEGRLLSEEDTHQGPFQPETGDVLPTMTPPQGRGLEGGTSVVTMAVPNATEQGGREEYQAMMHPDIAVAPALGNPGNFSAELETA